MSDLISKEAVIELIDNRMRNRKLDGTSIFLRNDEAIDIQYAVEELPTEYDVDKVVEQLEKASYNHADYGTDNAVDTETAIQIVKDSGINE